MWGGYQRCERSRERAKARVGESEGRSSRLRSERAKRATRLDASRRSGERRRVPGSPRGEAPRFNEEPRGSTGRISTSGEMLMHKFVRPAAVLAIPALVLSTTACDIVTAELHNQATAHWEKTYDLTSGGHVEVRN